MRNGISAPSGARVEIGFGSVERIEDLVRDQIGAIRIGGDRGAVMGHILALGWRCGCRFCFSGCKRSCGLGTMRIPFQMHLLGKSQLVARHLQRLLPIFRAIDRCPSDLDHDERQKPEQTNDKAGERGGYDSGQ